MKDRSPVHQFEPDYDSPPGETLAEVLDERGMSQADLARRLGMSTKHVNQIMQGLAPISADTALKLELVTGTPAQVWTNLEAAYQVARTRKEEVDRLATHVGWLPTLPVAELTKRGFIRKGGSPVERLRDVLAFFKVASPDAWQQVWAAPTAYRQSKAFDVNYGALAAWLRIGEVRAEGLKLPAFDRAALKDSLGAMRDLTLIEDPQVWLPRLEGLLSAAGVAFVIEREITGARINGAVRWLPSDRPLIQLSLCHRWADIFWFTLFHEIGHVLLHDRRRLTIVDGGTGAASDNSMEAEADEFAGRTLLPRAFDSRLSLAQTYYDVIGIARDAGVHPGVVVGRLQHDRRIPYNQLNGLRVRFVFADD